MAESQAVSANDPRIRPRRTVPGRRRGRALRRGQAALVKTLLPQLAIPVGDGALDPSALFEPCGDVWLEVGFGGGEHLLAQARAHPRIGMIGCEPYLNGIAKLLARMESDPLANIRIYRGDARDLIAVLTPGSVGRAFLLFPDPWPKRRHHKRRFIAPDTLHGLARALRPGALFRVATDSPAYARWTLIHMRQRPDFAWCAASAAAFDFALSPIIA